MKRRHFIEVAAGTCLTLAGSMAVSSAVAATQCGITAQGPVCRSQVNFSEFHQTAYQNQRSSQWCWAACIAMVFAFNDHPVSQQRIVREAYGSLINWPAPGMVIARALQRRWRDDDGDEFQVRIDGLYDSGAGILATDNARIVRALDQDRPLIIGARGHAMVLTALDYQHFQNSIVPKAAGVFDPFPGRGPRGLMPDELVPTHQGGSLQFIAGFRID